MMKGRKFPFLIENTNQSDKAGTHWWSILHIDPKRNSLLFDSFGVKGLKNFIIQDDKKIVEKVIKGIEKIERKDNKLTLIKLRFSVKNFCELKDNEKLSLSETAQDLSHFIENFGRYENQVNVNMWMLEGPTQKIETDTCGLFQIYFYDNLFFPTKIASYTHTKN